MDESRRQIVRLSIAYYERIMEIETDEARLRTIRCLLAEARSEAALLEEEAALERPETAPRKSLDQANRLRMKAEECRAIADTMFSEGGRSVYLRFARDYDLLADRAEGRARALQPSLPH